MDTVNTTHEFMLVGTIMRRSLIIPSMFFLTTGAFHTANNTFDVYKRVYINNASDATFGDNYRYDVTNMNSNPVVYFD